MMATDTGFTIPTMATIVARVRGDLNAAMGNTNALIPRSLAYVAAHMIAGAVWGAYLYQRWAANQTIPDVAEGAQLERWARLWGVYRRASVKATGTVAVVGAAGATLADAATLTGANGLGYIVTGGPYVWATSTTKAVTVEADTVGTDWNLTDGTGVALELDSPPAGIVSTCQLSGDITGGLDEGTDAQLLSDLLIRMQTPPHGGSAADYEVWVKAAVAMVDRVWVVSWRDDTSLAQGTVKVPFIMEQGYGSAPIGILPSVAQLNAAQAYLTTAAPVTANPEVQLLASHPAALAINYRLSAGGDAATMKAAALAAVRAKMRETFTVSYTSQDVPNSYFQEALAQAEGLDWFEITDVDGGGATADLTVPGYSYPTCVATDLTWTAV